MDAMDIEPDAEVEPVSIAPSERDLARKRLQDRRDLASHAVAFVVINAALLGAWAITGGGYFWPAWVLAGWGVGLVLHAWNTFAVRPITDEDIDSELRRGRR